MEVRLSRCSAFETANPSHRRLRRRLSARRAVLARRAPCSLATNEPTDALRVAQVRRTLVDSTQLTPHLSYRLNALGFSSSPPTPGPPTMAPHIPIQAPDDLDLNVGFKDQLEALQWIHREIANFGGDPTKVRPELVRRTEELIQIAGHACRAQRRSNLCWAAPALLPSAPLPRRSVLPSLSPSSSLTRTQYSCCPAPPPRSSPLTNPDPCATNAAQFPRSLAARRRRTHSPPPPRPLPLSGSCPPPLLPSKQSSFQHRSPRLDRKSVV